MDLESVNFMKVGDVAAQLSVSEQTVRVWCRTGVLPAYRPPSTRQWLIDPQELSRWLEQSAVRSTMEFLQAPYRETEKSDEDLVASFLADREVTPENKES